MTLLNFSEFLNESVDNTLKDGEYFGTIKGYDVTIDSTKYTFKTLTGYRNMFPIRVYVVVKNGSIIVYSKQGVLFTSEKDQKDYLTKYQSINDDPLFITMSDVLKDDKQKVPLDTTDVHKYQTLVKWIKNNIDELVEYKFIEELKKQIA